jgi:hypothetical protein
VTAADIHTGVQYVATDGWPQSGQQHSEKGERGGATKRESRNGSAGGSLEPAAPALRLCMAPISVQRGAAGPDEFPPRRCPRSRRCRPERQVGRTKAVYRRPREQSGWRAGRVKEPGGSRPTAHTRRSRCAGGMGDEDIDVAVFRFTLGIPGFDDRLIPRVVGLVLGGMILVNHVLGAQPTPEAQVADTPHTKIPPLTTASSTLPALEVSLRPAGVARRPHCGKPRQARMAQRARPRRSAPSGWARCWRGFAWWCPTSRSGCGRPCPAGERAGPAASHRGPPMLAIAPRRRSRCPAPVAPSSSAPRPPVLYSKVTRERSCASVAGRGRAAAEAVEGATNCFLLDAGLPEAARKVRPQAAAGPIAASLSAPSPLPHRSYTAPTPLPIAHRSWPGPPSRCSRTQTCAACCWRRAGVCSWHAARWARVCWRRAAARRHWTPSARCVRPTQPLGALMRQKGSPQAVGWCRGEEGEGWQGGLARGGAASFASAAAAESCGETWPAAPHSPFTHPSSQRLCWLPPCLMPPCLMPPCLMPPCLPRPGHDGLQRAAGGAARRSSLLLRALVVGAVGPRAQRLRRSRRGGASGRAARRAEPPRGPPAREPSGGRGRDGGRGRGRGGAPGLQRAATVREQWTGGCGSGKAA